jgi:hypothetical protein
MLLVKEEYAYSTITSSISGQKHDEIMNLNSNNYFLNFLLNIFVRLTANKTFIPEMQIITLHIKCR